MANAKTTTLSFRIERGLKDAVRTATGNGHRSIANMIEVMIRDYRGRAGLAIQEERAMPLLDERRPRA